ncbi:hypothetical protein PSUB009319_04990 [Ralstonia sp. SET104]|nr:hypothetical protein PSUB009319_04990 [Ralstonia sp. SET104]
MGLALARTTVGASSWVTGMGAASSAAKADSGAAVLNASTAQHTSVRLGQAAPVRLWDDIGKVSGLRWRGPQLQPSAKAPRDLLPQARQIDNVGDTGGARDSATRSALRAYTGAGLAGCRTR